MEESIVNYAIAIILIMAGAFGYFWGSRLLGPFSKAKEYVNWYKVGRIKQFADEHKINIDKVIAYEEIRDQKKITKTWTQKIENELSKDLDKVEEFKEKK